MATPEQEPEQEPGAVPEQEPGACLPMVKQLLTVDQAVEASGIPKSSLMRMIYQGDIAVIQRAKNTRIWIDPAELRRWMEAVTHNAQQRAAKRRRQNRKRKTPAA